MPSTKKTYNQFQNKIVFIGSSFKLLLPRRVTFAFLSCSMPGDEAEFPFAGFSIHCSDYRLFKRVRDDVQVTADKGWGFLKVFSDFIYLSPQVPRRYVNADIQRIFILIHL